MRIKYQKEFTGFDGTKLLYQYWPIDPLNKESNVVVLLHSGDSDGVLNDFIEAINLPQYVLFTTNLRSGLFSDNREMSDFSILVHDFYEFISQIKDNYGIQESKIIVVSESISALAVAAWLHDYAPQIMGAILLTPTFSIGGKTKFCKLHHLLTQRQRHKSQSAINSNIKDYSTVAMSFLDTAKRIILDASAIYTPIILLIDQQESALATQREQKCFYNSLSSSYKKINIIDSDSVVANKIKKSIEEMAGVKQVLPSLLNADQQGKTKEEFDRLAAPETHPLKKVRWTMSRIFLKYVGALSNGIRLGLIHGFDSGISLDYVYKNTPSGRNILGKLLDKIYLNNRSWKSVRQRKKNLEALLLIAIDKVLDNKQTVNILDIASGNGGYLFDFIAENNKKINHVLMRDYVNINVLQGVSNLKEKNIIQQVDFEWGDAFSEQSLTTLPKDRTIAIASGFYELFDNNQMVIRSLKGVADSLEKGGFLIFTTKIWNPNLEYMARVMSSHKDGKAWLLRRRYQLEIDQLMREAGFIKVTQRVDSWGIFTVTLVQKY